MKLNVVRQQARGLLQAKHLTYSTEKAYLGWIERYGAWLRSNPDPGGPASVEAFLSNLNAATIEPHPGAADRADETNGSRRPRQFGIKSTPISPESKTPGDEIRASLSACPVFTAGREGRPVKDQTVQTV